jgi:hypothetical protein
MFARGLRNRQSAAPPGAVLPVTWQAWPGGSERERCPPGVLSVEWCAVPSSETNRYDLRLPTIAAKGGMTNATMLMTTAAVVE